LIQELGRLPGIGEKTATRLAMFLLRCPEEDALRLAESVVEVKRKIRFCTTCFHLSEGDLCEICRNPSRDRGIVCVVEDPDSLFAIEESGTYRGLYHVLHGVLAPLDGVGPEDLKIRELLERVDQGTIQEIILATNPTVQGESTALLIMKMLGERTVRVTRIAQGMPVGGDLKYTDRMTLAKSIECRRCM
jgi:recombination protein RecR